MNGHPISELPDVYRKMAAWANETDVKVVRESTTALRNITNTYASRFHMTKRGVKVPLRASGDVKPSGRGGLVGRVAGYPEGFWTIVEYGRGGGYLVASRSTRSGGRRSGGQASLFRSFENETIGTRLAPIRTPYGPRMWARPGPHGPIGKPWATSMTRGGSVIRGIHDRHRTATLVRAFTS